jgi:MraZ protein
MDEKGRVVIPPKFRLDLGQSFVITKGLDGCLFVLRTDRFRVDFEEKFQANSLDPRQRRIQRFFFAEALDATTDTQGRIAIPSSLRAHAGLEPQSEVMVVGLPDRVEIWSRERWSSYNESFSDEDLVPSSAEAGVAATV